MQLHKEIELGNNNNNTVLALNIDDHYMQTNPSFSPGNNAPTNRSH